MTAINSKLWNSSGIVTPPVTTTLAHPVAVRELCLRQPLVMEEDLLRDLVQYKKYRDKQVS